MVHFSGYGFGNPGVTKLDLHTFSRSLCLNPFLSSVPSNANKTYYGIEPPPPPNNKTNPCVNSQLNENYSSRIIDRLLFNEICLTGRGKCTTRQILFTYISINDYLNSSVRNTSFFLKIMTSFDKYCHHQVFAKLKKKRNKINFHAI